MNPYKEIFRKFFSEYADTLRKRRGLTQEQMAEKLRITGRAYSDLERTLSHLHFQREAQRLRCSGPGMGNEKRSAEIHCEVSIEARASSFGVYCHSCRLHQERRCSVSLSQYHVLREARNNRHTG